MATNLWNYSIWYEVDEASLKRTYDQIVSEIEKTWKVSQETLNKMISSWTQEWVIAAKKYLADLKTELMEMQEQQKINKKLWDDVNFSKWIQQIEEMKTKIKSAESTVKQLENQTNTSWNKMSNIFKKIWTYVAGAFAVQKIVQFWKTLVEWSDNATAAEKSFETMFWSAEKAKNLMADLNKFSVDSFTDVETVRENAKQLYAMWIEYEKLIPTMTSLWNVASALNIPLERLALNYWQVKTQWKLSWTDLRDFLKAWVPLTEELAKNLWVSAEEIKKMVSEWKIWFSDVEKAFETMTSAWWVFYNQMAMKWETVAWQIEKLKTQFQIFATNIAQLVVPWLTQIFERFNKIFDPGPANQFEVAISKLNNDLDDMQDALSDYNKELNKLNNDFAKWVISVDTYTTEHKRLSREIDALEKEIAETNAKIQEQKDLMQIWTDIARNHTEELSRLESEQSSLEYQLQQLNQEFRDWTISEEEYNEQSMAVRNSMEAVKNESANLQVQQQKENTLYKLLTDSWMSAAQAKETLANLKIQNGADLTALSNEAKYANNTAMSYLAMAKAKAQAEVLSAKQALDSQKAKDDSFWWYLLRWWTFSSVDPGQETKKQKQLKEDLKVKQEYLDWLIKIEEEGNAFYSNLDFSVLWNPTWWSGWWTWWWSGGWGGWWWGWGWWWSGWWSSKIKQTEQEVKNLEKAYKDMDSSLDKANKAAEKYNDAQQKFWKETNDDIKKIDDSLAKLKDNYEKTIQSINDALNEKNSNDVSSYVKDQYTKMRDLQKEISNMERWRDDDWNSVDYDWSKISKYRSQIEEIKRNLDEVWEISWLWDSWIDAIISKVKERYDLETEEAKKLYDLKEQLRKNEEEALAKKEEELKKYEEEKKALERKKLITQAMQQANIKNEAELDEFKKKIAYDQFSLEEQQIIDKYAQEKIELFNKKMDAIAAAEEYYQKEQELMNQNHVVAMSNVKSLSAEYSKLLSQLSTAISRQRTLNALRSSWWYAEWWYTWNWNPYDVAWVVHKWEWVMPNWMVKSMQWTVAGLEAIRTWNSSVVNNNTSKHQTNNITVNSRFDIEWFLWKANWKF